MMRVACPPSTSIKNISRSRAEAEPASRRTNRAMRGARVIAAARHGARWTSPHDNTLLTAEPPSGTGRPPSGSVLLTSGHDLLDGSNGEPLRRLFRRLARVRGHGGGAGCVLR